MKAKQVHAPALVLPVLLLAGTGTTAGPDEPAPLSDLLVDASEREDRAMPVKVEPETTEADDWRDREALTGDWGVRCTELHETRLETEP